MWLKVSYWAVVIADLIFGLILLFSSKVTQWFWQLDSIQGNDLMWTKYFGAMVISWTFLCLWGVKKPVERKGVLFLTIIPVIAGLIGVELYSIISISPSPGLWFLIGMQTGIAILIGYSLYNARDLVK